MSYRNLAIYALLKTIIIPLHHYDCIPILFEIKLTYYIAYNILSMLKHIICHIILIIRMEYRFEH